MIIRGIIAFLLIGLSMFSCAHFGPIKFTNEPQIDRNTGNYLIARYSEESKLNYIITFPKNYDLDQDTNWPVIIFLHSMAERGTDLLKLVVNTPGEGNGIIPYALKTSNFQFITVSPLCPDKSYWPQVSNKLDSLIKDITQRYNINIQKIYLTGVSMGGMGVWSLSMKYPHWFAAIAPISGGIYTPPMIENIKSLKSIPIWAFHDKNDPEISISKEQGTIDRLSRINDNVKYTISEKGIHYIHEQIFDSGQLFTWFLQYKKDS